MSTPLRLADLAAAGAAVSISDAAPKVGDTELGLLAKIAKSLDDLTNGVTRYLGMQSYPFGASDAGSLAELMATELALYPTVREVAIYNAGGSMQTVNGDSLNAGDAVGLTLSEVIAGTYDVASAGAEELIAFFIA